MDLYVETLMMTTKPPWWHHSWIPNSIVAIIFSKVSTKVSETFLVYLSLICCLLQPIAKLKWIREHETSAENQRFIEKRINQTQVN